MANTTATTNSVALASLDPKKLKHWTQAIRDLYEEFDATRQNLVPRNHASATKTYGIGDTFKYGHLRLLDKLLYQFKQQSANVWWVKSNYDINTNYNWNAVTWHGGLFVAVGSNGRIAKSRDGKTWDDITWIETTTSTKNFELFDVKWCGSMFVAVGSYNCIVYSFDGSNWYLPMYIGSSITASGTLAMANSSNYAVRPSTFEAKDAWKGIAYDNRTGVIFLCGTQCRTLTCRHVPLENRSSIRCGTTMFHTLSVTDVYLNDHYQPTSTNLHPKVVATSTLSTLNSHTLNSAAAKDVFDAQNNITKTKFVAAGTWSEVVQGTVNVNALNPLDLIWPTKQSSGANPEPILNSRITIEDDYYTIENENITADVSWNNISVQHGSNDVDMFVMIGTNGRAMVSADGEGDSWQVPHEYVRATSIKTNFQCQATGWNLSVIAGTWNTTIPTNITMYNDSSYMESEDTVFGQEPVNVQQFHTKVDNASWNGAAYGESVFVLVGTDNRIYWCEIEEEDFTGAALSVLFYKHYIAQLEQKVAELENEIVVTDLSFNDVSNTTLNFLWTDPKAQLYRTSGNITLNFVKAPYYIYKEMMIYLEAENDTTLTLVGGEWENDLMEPQWGKAKSHLALKAIFVGLRVIVHIIDNDQLGDNISTMINSTSQNTGNEG